MPEPPPRKRFQIHLSTAIVMMFVAGGLMWANIRQRSEMIEFPFSNVDGPTFIFVANYGWPLDGYRDHHFRGSNFSLLGIALNACTALSLLFAAWFFCEWLIRRRSARK